MRNRIGKMEMVRRVSDATGVRRRDAEQVIEALLNEIRVLAVHGGTQVVLPGFGKFEGRERPARKVRNPRTGEETLKPEETVLHFKRSKAKT